MKSWFNFQSNIRLNPNAIPTGYSFKSKHGSIGEWLEAPENKEWKKIFKEIFPEEYFPQEIEKDV